MSRDDNNPFSNYGNVLDPSQFVGRKKAIQTIRDRVLGVSGFGSIEIVGEARIGKTSLMYYLFRKEITSLLDRNIVPVDLGSIATLKFSHPMGFFHHLMKKTLKALKTFYGDAIEDLVKELNPYLETEHLYDFFEIIRSHEFRIIVLIDEFDGIQNLFKEQPEAFNNLRELGYNPKHKIAYIVTSRVGVGVIELRSSDISILAGIYDTISLGLMNNREIEELWLNRLKDCPIQFSDDEKAELQRYAGNHPFFLDMLAFHLYRDKRIDEYPSSLTDTIKGARREVNRIFANFRERLGEGRFITLLKIVYENYCDEIVAQELVYAGHIIEKKSNNKIFYIPFSQLYHEYLTQAYMNIFPNRTNITNSLDIYNQEQPKNKRSNSRAKKTILFFAANPMDTPSIQTEREFREIQEKLKSAQIKKFNLQERFAVRLQDLTQALLDENPAYVHFSGHGIESGNLYFQGEGAYSTPATPNAIGNLFALFSNRIECVILNSCYGFKQAEAIVKHIDWVIGMSDTIIDGAAIYFSVGFYQALGAGKTIQEAFDFGRVQVNLQIGSVEAEKIFLLRREGYSFHFDGS